MWARRKEITQKMEGSKKCFKKRRSGIGGKQENTELLVEDVASFEFGRVEVGLDAKTARREEINEECHADKTIFQHKSGFYYPP